MAMWTKAQAEAINAPVGKGGILVGAAAGSGKTAVLVERVITKLLNGETDIDRLLIVTFTDAAAGEMKEKIILRLQKALDEAEEERTRKHLNHQLRLAGGADITTIDAFCLRAVKNNFHALGADPNFFIADTAEAELLMDDTLESLFNDLYVENNERFLELVAKYASNRDDKALKRLVLTIYRFIQSFAEPIKWLDDSAAMYEEDMSRGVWAKKYIIENGCNRLGREYKKYFTNLAEDMVRTAIQSGGETEPYMKENSPEMNAYWGTLWQGICLCINVSGILGEVSDWDEAYGFYQTYIEAKNGMDSLTPSKVPKTKQSSDEDWKLYCKKRNELKKSFKAAAKKLVSMSADDFNAEVSSADLSRTANDIAWLVKRFDEAYADKKESRGLKEFHDVEHLAYRLFRKNSAVRGEYRDKYDEILIDEYQDTNGLQDSIFAEISKGGSNIFMVGDLKQSIYGFRGGDPSIFKKKQSSYNTDASDGLNIMLSQNFRSRQEILKSVNDIFCCVMSDEAGDVNYDGGELIVREEERECYPPSESDNISELHWISLIGGDDEPELPDGAGSVSDKLEAAYIADRIRELIEGRYQIYDKDTGSYRDIRCRDITILSKSVRYNSDLYMNALSGRGIPAFIELENYFERREIQLMLTLISLIDNHLQDIELVSVMRSPIGAFSDNELARIRIFSKHTEYFYYAVQAYADGGEDRELREKCVKFSTSLKRWRGYVKQKSVANLIWTIYSETGFYDFMGVLEGGEEAQANLRLLYERAKKYEQSGFKGLFNFLRYIEKLQNRSEDLSGAKLIGENHDVVRIMTIHKSKGLEFPVVFLAGMGKRLRGRPNEESRVLLNKDMGFGLKYADAQKSYYKDTLMKNLVAEANDTEEISEAMRLMYVGMTRAKEKLIITGVRKYTSSEKREEEHKKWESLTEENGKMLPSNALKAKCYMDWLCPAAFGSGNWRLVDAGVSDISSSEKNDEEEAEQVSEPSEELIEAVGKILDFTYKYAKSGAIPSKTSVSALKQLHGKDVETNMEAKPNEYDFAVMSRTPRFMREKTPSNEIGTAYHQLMAYIDLDGIYKSEDKPAFAEAEIKRLISEGQIDEEAVTENMAERCAAFFESEMGKRMFRARKVFREQNFQIDIPARLYDESLGRDYDGETIILQGIIDCFFEEEDGIVLIDYKTDKVKSIDEIREKYRMQLDLYAEAIEKITKKTVKEKYLYLFSVKSVVQL